MTDEIVDVEAVEDVEGEEAIRSAELVIREERAKAMPPASILPSSHEWEATMAVAREIADTQFVPESYRGKPDAVVAAILTGREMGIGPMQALRQIHMIDGRPAFSADLMMAKMRAGGVMILDSKISDEGAWIKARRKDTGEETEVEWTKEDAEKAGLLSKKNWRTYPKDMYWARVVGRLARKLGSDLLGGLVYAKEEMEDWDEGGYGGASGFEARPAKPFDRDTDLLPGAIPGSAEAPKQIAEGLNQLDPTVDWGAMLNKVALFYDGELATWRDLPENDRPDFWRRLSNTECWIREHAGNGDFPPPPKALVEEGFKFAFGITIEVVYKGALEDDVSFESAESDST